MHNINRIKHRIHASLLCARTSALPVGLNASIAIVYYHSIAKSQNSYTRLREREREHAPRR
jgi:hypothetical protein